MTLKERFRVTRLAPTGEGIASENGRALFIAGALPGELVETEPPSGDEVRRARLERVVEASPERVAVACPYFPSCGGCDFLHLAPSAQRAARESVAIDLLTRVGGLDLEALPRRPTVFSESVAAVRRRAVLHGSKSGLGFFEEGTHHLVEIDACVALTPRLSGLPGQLAQTLGRRCKDIKHLTLVDVGDRVSAAVLLKTNVTDFWHTWAASTVRAKLLAGVVVQKEGHPRPECQVGEVEHEDGGVQVRPDVFLQNNAELNQRLVEAVAAAAPSGRVLELFAGSGNLTRALARSATEITAVEADAAAIELGRKAALRWKAAPIRWIAGDVFKVAKNLARNETFEGIVLDPPRDGARGLEAWAGGVGATRLVYVSCNPATLARDARALLAQRWRPTSLQFFDMFPGTRHLETVLTLERSA